MPPKKRQSNLRQSRTNTQDIRAHLGLSQRESQTQNKYFDDDILIADYRIAKQRITRHQGPEAVARRVERLYDLQQEQLKQALAQSRLKIHFTCDTWTSNYAAIELLAVTARWVTPEGSLTKALLNLHNPPLGHAGLETALRLIQTIKQFGTTNPGYMTFDNADCNDTMMKEMSEDLERDMGIIWDPTQYRTRCFGASKQAYP
ncbi:hypothetical protein KCU62_g9479, partial [Aureobasidium sp. EXF-3399]